MKNWRDKPTNKDSIEDDEWNFKKIMKDVERFSSTHMTWKERKAMENDKVVALGGKLPPKQRLPLSVARVQMKKQKQREQRIQQRKDEESLVLGRFMSKSGGCNKKSAEKRKPVANALKATEGYFRDGVLNVKHLLKPTPSSERIPNAPSFDGIGKKKKGVKKKNKGGKKRGGGGRKRH